MPATFALVFDSRHTYAANTRTCSGVKRLACAGIMLFLPPPLLVLPFYDSLPAMVLTLVLSRLLSWPAYLGICLHSHPDLRQRRSVDRGEMRALLAYGGWMTLSNVAAPLLLYLGRLLIAVYVSAEAVAYFSTPYDVVINLLVDMLYFVVDPRLRIEQPNTAH